MTKNGHDLILGRAREEEGGAEAAARARAKQGAVTPNRYL